MFDEYRDKLHADARIDHDEQIYGAIEVLLRDAAVRRAVQRECRHLLVDEFQDLTPAQLLMLRLVAAPAYDVFGVGDDDQVIYGYAGADPEFLINYDRYFPGGTHHALDATTAARRRSSTRRRNLLSYNRRRIDKQIVAAKPDDDARAPGRDRRRPSSRRRRARRDRTGDQVARPAPRPTDDRGAEPRQRVAAAGAAAVRRGGRAVLDAGERRGAEPHRHPHRARLPPPRARGANADAASRGTDLATRGPPAVAARSAARCCSGSNAGAGGARGPARRRERRTRAADKFDVFCDDLEALGRAIDGGRDHRALLRRIRDDIGLGAALATLDLSGKGPTRATATTSTR